MKIWCGKVAPTPFRLQNRLRFDFMPDNLILSSHRLGDISVLTLGSYGPNLLCLAVSYHNLLASDLIISHDIQVSISTGFSGRLLERVS